MVGMVVESGGWSCCGVSGSLGAKRSYDEKRQSGVGIPTVTSAAGDVIRSPRARTLLTVFPRSFFDVNPYVYAFPHRLPLRAFAVQSLLGTQSR
jgi:hypothetical protein